MRGKQKVAACLQPTIRNIPAYAGKTGYLVGPHSGLEEHPRVCGENGAPPVRGKQLVGTSPRMRGKPPESTPQTTPEWNIPAYAGKTFAALLR